MRVLEWPLGKPPAFLMVDDFGPLLVFGDGLRGDWGYLGEEGTWDFIVKLYKSNFTDLKIALFSPARRLVNYGKKLLDTREGGNWRRLLARLARESWVEIAFHGIVHGHAEGSFVPEPERVGDLLPWLREGKRALEELSGGEIIGGKAPAYSRNREMAKVARQAGFRWWAGEHHPKGRPGIRKLNGVWVIPSTVSARVSPSRFNRIVWWHRAKCNILRRVDYLISSRMPVVIQTHYASLRADGTRQAHNVYDDARAILLVLRYIQGRVWWALPREIVDFLDTREKVSLEPESQGFYMRGWGPARISIQVGARALTSPSGKTYYPDGWVFTVLPEEGLWRAHA